MDDSSSQDLTSNPKFLSAFDLDHTLLKGNGSVRFGLYLYQKGVFGFSTLLRLFASYTTFKMGYSSIEQLHERVFSLVMRGKAKEMISQWVLPFIEETLESFFYPPMLRRFQDAQRAGHHTLLLSSSPDFLVEAIARYLKVDGWKGSVYSIDADNRFSHISQILLSSSKVSCVREVSAKLAIPKKQIIVYSDSYLDLAFLQEAGHAVAVRPDRRLYAFSKKMHWEIVK